jgi:hypothetical protein
LLDALEAGDRLHLLPNDGGNALLNKSGKIRLL